jgi:transporter family-2 protein
MLYYAILLLAGLLQGVMVSLNGQLGGYYSLFGISFFVHAVGLVLLLAYLFAIRRQKLRLRGAPWYVYFVGALGIAIVASSSWCTLKIGATAMLALSTAGQLLSSELIDQFGLFGMPVVKFSPRQLPGYVLVAGGVALVVFL